MLSVVLHMQSTDKVAEEEMTSLHFTRPLATYVGVLGGASAATDALSPTHGLCAALSSFCNLHASPLTGVCREYTTCSCQVDLRITGYIASDIVPSA
jgi:hypothetical protein